MILQVQESTKSNIFIKNLTWKDRIKRDIYNTNLHELEKITKIKIKNHTAQKQKQIAANNLLNFMENNTRIQLIDNQSIYQCHSYYSSYIPLKKKSKFDDEYLNTFPYFVYLQQRSHLLSKSNYYHQISTCIRKSKQINNVQIGWKTCLDQFLCTIDTITAIQLYAELLKKGTNILDYLHHQFGGKCRKQIFFHRICQTSKYFRNNFKISKALKLSVQTHEQINQVTMSKTMKNLFCSICLIYDCGQHTIDENTIEKGFQYIAPKNIRTKSQHMIQALKICNFHYNILNKTNINQQLYNNTISCSEKCYTKLNYQKYNILQQLCSRLLSPMVKGLMKIGIQLFSYQPCRIWNLFPQQNKLERSMITCQLVYLYFVEQYNLYQRINRKLQPSQLIYLNRQSSVEVGNGYAKPVIVPTKRGKRNNNISQVMKNTQTQISTCFHHFINHQPFDLNCQNCVCRERGFCLPQCLCSQLCPIKKRGCLCKHQYDECKSKKCACFLKKQQCQPSLCLNCFQIKNINKKNNCQNDLIIQKKLKLIKIGQSTVHNAGLGAFAAENIKKGQLVSIYVGQLIQHQIDTVRQSLSHNLSFYNFGSPQGTIDARFMGNKSRFINHGDSGRQNLRTDVILSSGSNQIAFYAQRDIDKGQQLFFDYDGQGQLFRNHKHKYPFIKKKK